MEWGIVWPLRWVVGQGSPRLGSHWKLDLFLIAEREGQGIDGSREEALFHAVIGKFHFAVLICSSGHGGWGSPHCGSLPTPAPLLYLCILWSLQFIWRQVHPLFPVSSYVPPYLPGALTRPLKAHCADANEK